MKNGGALSLVQDAKRFSAPCLQFIIQFVQRFQKQSFQREHPEVPLLPSRATDESTTDNTEPRKLDVLHFRKFYTQTRREEVQLVNACGSRQDLLRSSAKNGKYVRSSSKGERSVVDGVGVDKQEDGIEFGNV